MRLLLHCFAQGLLPRHVPPLSPVLFSTAPAASSASFSGLSSERRPSLPQRSLPLRAVSMSTSVSDASNANASRREKAAQAAERRRQASATTAAAVSSSASSPGLAVATAAALAEATTKTADHCGNPEGVRAGTWETRGASSRAGGGVRKRRGSPASVASVQQIAFSDSEGSESEATTLGISGRPATSGDRDIKGFTAARVVKAVEDGPLGATAAGNVKRRRMETTARTSVAAGAVAAHAAIGSGQPRQNSGASLAAGSSGGSSPHAAKKFRVVSWNIDCLNGENKMARVEEVCAILKESEPTPDAILLQEVDGDMFPVLNARLGAGGRYRAHPMSVPVGSRYFTIVFVKVGTVTVHNSGREDFPDSRMGRDLLTVRAVFNGKPILIATSHLESEKQSSNERKAQFNQVLRQLLAFRGGPAIFAGDTNLREVEVKQEKLAREAGDVWQLCGADPERRFTWDMVRNDNHVFGGGFQPRARYDRMFVNPEAKDMARSFTLLGTERMAPPHSCFPSDHFGLDACFEW